MTNKIISINLINKLWVKNIKYKWKRWRKWQQNYEKYGTLKSMIQKKSVKSNKWNIKMKNNRWKKKEKWKVKNEKWK